MPGGLRHPGRLDRLQDAAILGPVGEQDDGGGHRLARLADVAGLAKRRAKHLHRDADPVADRRPRLGLEQRDRLAKNVAVRRRSNERLRLRAERDETDLEPARKPVEERAHRGDSRIEAGRLDVVCPHRARDVDEEHDRCVLVGLRQPHARLGQSRGRQREREHEEDERKGSAPDAMALRRDLREEIEVREGKRVLRTAAVREKREGDQHRDRQQGQQQQGGAEVHPVAHLTPTCSSACAERGRASLAKIWTSAWPLTIRERT